MSETVDTNGETIARTSATDETTDGNAEDTREVVPNDGHNNGDNEEEGDGEDDNDGEGVPDMMSLLYGNEEDYEEDDDEEEDNHTPEDSAVGSVGDIKRGIKSVVVSESEETATKRRSSESNDSTTNKRIKAEPIAQESDTQHISQTDSATMNPPNPLTTTCEPIEVEDLPKDMKDFMTYLLGLSGNDLDSPDVSRISMYSQLRDISRTLQFKSMPRFLETFIPFVVTDFWQKANLEFTARAKTRGSHRKCSVVDKWKTDRMHDGLEMKCISIIGTEDKPYFRFGQLVVIQTAFQPPPNSSQPTVSRRKYLGYVTNHSVRAINGEHQSEVNHLRYFCREDKRDYTLIEEISFMTRYSDEMYERNDWLMIAQPVICIHHYVLQMKALFKFENFPVWRQIFSPLFSSKPSGVLCQINDSKFSSKHRECIQIAIDVVSNPSPAHSNFVLLKGSDKSYVLAEIVKQLVLCDGFGESKVLVTSNDTLGLRNLHQSLKRNTKRITDYFVTNDVSDLKDQTIKYIRHKLTKTLDEKKRSLYEQCLQYLQRDIHYEEMSVEMRLFLSGVYDQVKQECMRECSVIMGRVDDLCNDTMFYKLFSTGSPFSCCVIDGSATVTEPQLYSLLWFGINKFIFGYNSYEKNKDQNDICVRFGLTRSLCSRYLELYRSDESNASQSATVFDF